MDSKYINATKGRLSQGLNDVIQDVVNDDYLNDKINKVVSETKVYTGTVTKYFPYLHKSEVVLDNTKRKVICKNGLLFGTELLLLYTPTGDGGYSKSMHEKFIKPRGTLKACVVKIDNSKEYLLLTYFHKGELVGINPAKQGNMKLLLQSGANEFYIKFGEDGLHIATNKKANLKLKNFGEDTLQDYEKEYYTQSEMQKILLDVLSTINVDDDKLELVENYFKNQNESDSEVDNNSSNNDEGL